MFSDQESHRIWHTVPLGLRGGALPGCQACAHLCVSFGGKCGHQQFLSSVSYLFYSWKDADSRSQLQGKNEQTTGCYSWNKRIWPGWGWGRHLMRTSWLWWRSMLPKNGHTVRTKQQVPTVAKFSPFLLWINASLWIQSYLRHDWYGKKS